MKSGQSGFRSIRKFLFFGSLLLLVASVQAEPVVEVDGRAQLSPGNLKPTEFMAAARNVRKTFYWEKKDLATYVVLTKHLLATAIDNAQPGSLYTEQFIKRVLGLGYDLASMTWPGWDEKGIEVTDELRKVGLAAAQMIVKVADENNASAEIMHNNYWMLGAHLLAAGDAGKAKKAWQRALKIYSLDEGLGILAWIALADSVTNNDSENLDHQLELLVKEGGNLASTANQIRVARNIFLSNKL